MPFDYFRQKMRKVGNFCCLLCTAYLKYILIRFNVQLDAFPKLQVLFDFADLPSYNMSYLNIIPIILPKC